MRCFIGILFIHMCIGCGASSGTFRADGFRRHPYRVLYAKPQKRELISHRWRVDNFDRHNKPKEGPDYEMSIKIDADDDGEYSTSRSFYRYDLKLDNRLTNGVIWITTVPLSFHDQQKELPVLARNYVERVSGGGLFVVDMVGSIKTIVQRRFATRTIESRKCTISGRAAFVVTFEVASVDQLQLSPDSRWARAMVILVSTPYLRKIEGDGFIRYLPSLLAVGFTDQPENFDRNLEDFQTLVSNIRLGTGTVENWIPPRSVGQNCVIGKLTQENVSQGGSNQNRIAPADSQEVDESERIEQSDLPLPANDRAE